MKIRFPRNFAGLALFAILLAASVARAQTTPEMTFRPSLLAQGATSYSFAGKASVRNDGMTGGSSVHNFSTSRSERHPIAKGIFWSKGFAFSMNWIVSDAAVPVPVRLGELSLNFGYMRALAPGVGLLAFVRPGYYADFNHWTWNTVNAPVMAAVTYTPNARCLWLFGASFNYFSQYPVMPAVGFRWKFADRWTLNLGIPRFGVTWHVSDDYDLGVFASGQGGSFRTTRAPRDPVRVDLASTYVDYRELRVGLRVTIKDRTIQTATTTTTTTTQTRAGPQTRTETSTNTSPPTNTSFEVGCMIRRNFRYYQRDFTLRESPTFYVAFSMGAGGRM
jgi:hypothetical protein